jgi:hypothetical protein
LYKLFHVLMCWNPLENGNKTHKKKFTLITINSINIYGFLENYLIEL